jgi:hypothetical protein
VTKQRSSKRHTQRNQRRLASSSRAGRVSSQVPSSRCARFSNVPWCGSHACACISIRRGPAAQPTLAPDKPTADTPPPPIHRVRVISNSVTKLDESNIITRKDAMERNGTERLYSHAYAYSRFPNSQVLEGYRDPRPLVPPLFRRLGRARAPLGPPYSFGNPWQKQRRTACTHAREGASSSPKAVPMARPIRSGSNTPPYY